MFSLYNAFGLLGNATGLFFFLTPFIQLRKLYKGELSKDDISYLIFIAGKFYIKPLIVLWL